MKKEVVFAAKFDTSDFDKSVESMQKKLKEIYAPADMVRAQTQTQARLQQMGMGNTMSAPSADAAARATQQSRRELETAIRNEAIGQEKLGKIIAQRVEKLKELKAQQAKMVEGSEKELELKQKIARVEENNMRLRSTYMGRNQGINQLINTSMNSSPAGAQNALQAYQMGGLGGVGQWAGANKMAALGTAVGGLTTVAGAIGGIGALAERYTGYGQRLESAKGSAVANTSGRDLADLYAGRSPFEAIYSPERSAAAGLAEQKASRNRFTDRMKGVGSVGSMVLGGISFGAGALASMTGVGAAAGIPMMAAGTALMGGGAYGLSNDRTRMSLVPGSKEYQQLIAADQAKDFRNSYEDLKNQDPSKRLTVEAFEANRDRNVRAQRMMGLSNEQFYGENGFMANTRNAGFGTEAGLQMATSIIGAGGSARMGREAGFGLQMDRAGLNGSQMLGSLSGSIQAPEANKRAVISIMSEAFKIGLDNTDFAEENRRFAQAAANIIGKTGATSEADQDRLASTLGMFLGSKTNLGVDNAQNDYQKFQERSAQTTGRRGALRFSSAMQSPVLSKLSSSDLTELLSMKDEDLNSNNAAFVELAGQAGVSTDALAQEVRKSNKSGRVLSPGSSSRMKPAQDVLQSYMSKTGKSLADIGDDINNGRSPEEITRAAGRLKLEASKMDNQGGLTSGEGVGSIGEFLAGGVKSADLKGRAKSQLESSARIEDAYTKQAAQGADEARKAFNALTEELWKVVKGADAFKDAVAPTAKALSDAASANVKGLPQGSPTNQDVLRAITQSQANKPKGR